MTPAAKKLVERLRYYARQMGPTGLGHRLHLSADNAPMLLEAADEIERLSLVVAKAEGK